MRYVLLMFILCACSTFKTDFRPFQETSWICDDVEKHLGCKQSHGDYDNLDLHRHSDRELESLEVPY